MIVEQYHIYLPTINKYWNQVKSGAIDPAISGAKKYGSQALDHGSKLTSGIQEIVRDTYDKVSPQVRNILLIRVHIIKCMNFGN